MKWELVIIIECVAYGMGFLLGKAVGKHERHHNRRDKDSLPDDYDMRTYVPVRDRDRRGDHRRIVQVDEEGKIIE